MTDFTIYYARIIETLISKYRDEFISNVPGHCMKITGIPYSRLLKLWDEIHKIAPELDIFIIDENINSDKRFISATKLIELRNQCESQLLVLVPINSRTAAEDSYGNATFKEISLSGLETELLNDLKEHIPSEFKNTINNDIFSYIDSYSCTDISRINYLLDLEQAGYTKQNIGNFIFHFGLIPDEALLSNDRTIRMRLGKNIESLDKLVDFTKTLSERISSLGIERNTIQNDLAVYIKKENSQKTKKELAKIIFASYSNLNFMNWKFPDLEFKSIKVYIDKLFSSKVFEVNNGANIFRSNNKKGKLKLRVRTHPSPKDINEFKYFRILLMQSNGGAGDEVLELKKQKKTSTNRTYRDITVELDPNLIEEGIYFIKVQAEDDTGTILNLDDDFKDREIQDEYEREILVNPDIEKSSFDFKRTSDSDDFDFIVDDIALDVENENTNSRKEKVNTVLQAFINYNLGNLKKGEPMAFSPCYEEGTNCWKASKTNTKLSTFHLKYDNFNNYQINIPTKLCHIEQKILENSDKLASYRVLLDKNPSVSKLEIQTSLLELDSSLPGQLRTLRSNVFKAIKTSTVDNKGIIETFDLDSNIDLIKDYLQEYSNWLVLLKDRVIKAEGTSRENEIKKMVAELQSLDTILIQSKLPDDNLFDFKVISPLHPLMLSWFVNLYNQFKVWYDKAKDNDDYVKNWNKELDELIFDKLSPNVLPLVLQSDNGQTSYHNAGSLMFGWGLYIKPEARSKSLGVTSSSEQIKGYIRTLFNIESHQVWENDINTKAIIKQIHNYAIQHLYAEQLTFNIFNAGDASVFSKALIELEKIPEFKNISYNIRLFIGKESLVKPGQAFETLINPISNITEEAETFSQITKGKLYPKLRYSVNHISDYFNDPEKYTAHISFLLNPFPLRTELYKVKKGHRSLFCEDLILEPSLSIKGQSSDISWYKFIPFGEQNRETITSSILDSLMIFTSIALSSRLVTDYVPSTVLELTDRDYVLLSNLHDFSDWVITLDNHLGPEVYDVPADEKDKQVPFLLDYTPNNESFGVTSYLTTRPTSEVLALLSPHFFEFDLNVSNELSKSRMMMILEDLRAVSSSLILQLNSTSNKAFEVIGTAFTKRLLEKKDILKNGFLLPIDLHQELFSDLPSNDKSRADSLVVHVHPETNEIEFTIVEIKCRKSLNEQQTFELKDKIISQINNTELALRYHYDSTFNYLEDRLDRDFKTFELRKLLLFYLNKAARYGYMSKNSLNNSLIFLQELNGNINLSFNKIGIIYDFSATKKHVKETTVDNITFFTLGEGLIEDILDTESDLNTMRLENEQFASELRSVISTTPKNITEDIPQYQATFNELNDDYTSNNIDDRNNNDYQEGSAKVDGSEVELSDNEQKVNETEEMNPEEVSIEGELDLDSSMPNSYPEYDILIGKNSESLQYGVLGQTIHNKKVSLDLSETNTISLFGVQGGGKSYTIGTLTEMAVKEISSLNRLPGPLAGVIFHFSESMDYEPEFTSMIHPNDKDGETKKLKDTFGADPDKLEDVIILTPKDKVEERKEEYPSIDVYPIAFNSKELSVTDWLFLLGATGNDSTYIKQLKAIMKSNRRNLTLEAIHASVDESLLLSNTQKQLAKQRLDFAGEYIDDSFELNKVLKPGRLVLVDLRDEFIEKDEALGIFVIMQNIFAGVKAYEGKHFNKLLVFDEAHKYMDAKELTSSIVTAIREMRHKGVSIVIASQDPPSLPNEIIELSTAVILHKFNSPQWLKHIKKSITQIECLKPEDMSKLNAGECFLWATKATDKSIVNRPVKVLTRPRATLHGGATKVAH